MDSRASFTAETVALQRAFESKRPVRSRLFADPYADAFLRPTLRTLAAASGVFGVRRLASGLYDAVAGPGPRPSAIVRTKVIDDALTEADAEQCVLLGAGYDTRAHRLPALASKRVFEVDHPLTQAAKRRVISQLDLNTEHVTYVPVDFERDDLAEQLAAAGFDRTRETVFVWEGVTNYLTQEAIDGTLGVIHDLGHAGGTLIVTYVDVRALAEPSPFPEARRWVRAVARAGEPWTFGLHPDEVGAFLADRGFRLRTDVSTLDAGEPWFAAQHRNEHGSALYRVAVTEITHS
ncbi:class I SAM-dependent methyltransferase [Actinocrispum wychmicini]|uniref:S-adenosyl-L-methionine-dependent methyltransferase n=1 Tax=Actinocrispum wychmicini TaxID=1213861 RepID=A0A4R2J9L3_9PSEU|nr:SAM-dependent methyltransferase [Actinocrispum wychmicini]TCO54927.1 methyltransferase (TIGR00027 family) [Actinocrispum wychmicini]